MHQLLKKLKNVCSRPTLNGVKANIWHSADVPKEIFVLLMICLIVIGSFLTERILSMEKSRKAELRITQFAANGAGKGAAAKNLTADGAIRGMYVGSRNGTAFYLPWCGNVKLIHEENKIWFASKEEAAIRGYKPAGNCKGI